MKCPECVNQGQRSKVYDQGGSSTAMGWSPFYDEDGDYHSHNPNTHVNAYRCSNGHTFTTTTKPPCPNESCDYGRTPAGAGDPRDPNTTHSRCRRCDGGTQWGWCPACQPAEFARLP